MALINQRFVHTPYCERNLIPAMTPKEILMIRLTEIKLPLDHDENAIGQAIINKLKLLDT